MSAGDDQPEKPSQAEIERAEARAAERARREERRRSRAEKRARKGTRPSLRERLAAAARPDGERKPRAERRAEAERKRDAERKPGAAAAGAKGAAPPKDEESRGEVMQRRIAAVAILLVIAVVIMALTDAAPFFDDTSEEERVQDTVERFFAAYRAGDHETMCDLFSPDVKSTIESAGVTDTKGKDPQACAEVLDARVGTPAEDEQVSVKVDEVRVSGPRAIANLVLKTEGTNRRQMDAVELEKGPDGWLLTSPVVTS